MYHDYDMKKILERVRTCEKKKLIIDTDTYNEVDDQFAVAYALLSDDNTFSRSPPHLLTVRPSLRSRVWSQVIRSSCVYANT